MTIEVKNTPTQSIGIFNKNSRQEIDVINATEQKISISEQKSSQDINVDNALEQKVKVSQDVIIVPVYKDAPLYEGEYEVTPRVDKQTLPTAKKFLTEDVTINKIPYFEVSNNSGGITASIADRIDNV